jgi:hypothetical protein
MPKQSNETDLQYKRRVITSSQTHSAEQNGIMPLYGLGVDRPQVAIIHCRIKSA